MQDYSENKIFNIFNGRVIYFSGTVLDTEKRVHTERTNTIQLLNNVNVTTLSMLKPKALDVSYIQGVTKVIDKRERVIEDKILRQKVL